MIYGAILEKGEAWYTNMGRVFDAIQNRQRDYNWLITDCICYPNDAETGALLKRDHCWLTGDELTEMVSRESFQWIWAVLSGFDKDVPPERVLGCPLPVADGYEGFWENPLSMQHPLARVEIVPFDSSLTLLLSSDSSLVDSFRSALPLSRDLCEYNAERAGITN